MQKGQKLKILLRQKKEKKNQNMVHEMCEGENKNGHDKKDGQTKYGKDKILKGPSMEGKNVKRTKYEKDKLCKGQNMDKNFQFRRKLSARK